MIISKERLGMTGDNAKKITSCGGAACKNISLQTGYTIMEALGF